MILRQQITIDTDAERINNYPCIVVSETGQKFLFYEKFLTTGKQSYSRITFTSPSFIVNVEAGYGTINGVPVSWNAGSLIASPNSYQLVYVTVNGELGIRTMPTIYDTQNVIILAYVSTGASSITRIEEVEQSGYYIFVRKQIYTGSSWEWENYEYRLNTGQQPRAFYDSNTDKIYLSYLKDSISYLRVFEPSNELTWSYLPNIQINADIINLNRNPENTLYFNGGSSGYLSTANLVDNLYPMTTFDFAFINNNIYIFIPFLTGEYLKYIKSNLTYEIGYYIGETFIVEDSVTVPFTQHSFGWTLWNYSIGTKYIRVRLYTKLFSEEYITSPVYYKSSNLFYYPVNISLSDNNYNIEAKDNVLFFSPSVGYKSSIVKTIEYTESRTFKSDYFDRFSFSSGYVSSIVKTIEYTEVRTFKSDYFDRFSFSSGYKSSLTLINT